jgi:DNA-binding FadR family transcriptional regulator
VAEGTHERLLNDLGTAIASGELPGGSVLRLEQLQQQFGVSRTVAREVVRVLEAMRLTASRRRVGITVLPETEWNHYDPRLIRWKLAGDTRADALMALTELRSAVEPAAAALAARLASPTDRRQLLGIADDLDATARARDLHTFLGHDIAFHELVLRASANPMFRQLAEVVAEVLTGRTGHGLMPQQPQPEAVALHRAVAVAIDGGKPTQAEKAMRAIVTQARDEMAEFLRG